MRLEKIFGVFLAWFDSIGTDESSTPRLVKFAQIFLLVGSSKAIYIAIVLHQSGRVASATVALYALCGIIPAVFAVLIKLRSLEKIILRLTTISLLAAGLLLFPETANEHTLMFFVACVLGVFGIRPEETARISNSAIRWICFVALFGAGLQKIFHGTYFYGDFLIYMTAHDPRFSEFFSPFFSSNDLTRLTGFRGLAESGPYRVESSPSILWISNFVIFAEIVFPAMLLHRRTQFIGAIFSILLVVGIQAAALEYFFCLHMVNILFLFFPYRWHNRLLICYLALIPMLLVTSFF